MIAEIVLLVILFILVEITHSVFFVILFSVVFILCIPGIIALYSAPFVPTFNKNAKTMIKLADIKPGMKVYDLGAGDGKLVEAAAEKGADAIGYEISFALFLFFWLKKVIFLFLPCHSHIGGNPKGSCRVYWGNIWSKDISDADIVMCFLMPNAMDRFREKKYQTMKKGAKLVSNIFPLPKEKEEKKENNVYLYVRK